MKQFIIDILHPFNAIDRACNKKLEKFLDKFKKKYDERTIEENIVCDAYPAPMPDYFQGMFIESCTKLCKNLGFLFNIYTKTIYKDETYKNTTGVERSIRKLEYETY